jgi:hypothetical protein
MNSVKSSPSTATSPNASVLTSKSKTNEDKKREEEDGIKERRVIKMVVLNGVFNFCLRAPDMLFWLENENIWAIVFPTTDTSLTENVLWMYAPGILSFIADIGYFSYILTFTTNFFIFYKFNSKFKEAVVIFSSKNLF